jgi:hypothetical protein
MSPLRHKALDYEGGRYHMKEITGESGVLIQALKHLL